MDATEKKVLNKFRGTLLGCGIGDAVGFIAEKNDPDWCEGYFADYLDDNSAAISIRRRGQFAFGQYSDDTQQTRYLAESLLACDGWKPEHFAAIFRQQFLTGEMVGTGLATRQSCLNLINGLPWDQAGMPAPMAGNGGAMRVSPVALWFNDSPTAIINTAREQAWVTHQDHRVGDCAALVGLMIYHLLPIESGLSPLAILERLDDDVARFNDLATNPILHTTPLRPFNDEVLHGLHILNKLMRKNPEYDLLKSADYITHNLDSRRDEAEWHYISPFVMPTVFWSMAAFLRNPESFDSALRWAICCGGDVDTTGAITGAMSGAYLGRNKLPTRVIHKLTDCGSYGGDYLTKLADAIYAKRF